jgi:hypothetical protein
LVEVVELGSCCLNGIGGMTSIGSPCDLMDSAVDIVDPCDILENMSEPCNIVRVLVVPDVVDICENPEELEEGQKDSSWLGMCNGWLLHRCHVLVFFRDGFR